MPVQTNPGLKGTPCALGLPRRHSEQFDTIDTTCCFDHADVLENLAPVDEAEQYQFERRLQGTQPRMILIREVDSAI